MEVILFLYSIIQTISGITDENSVHRYLQNLTETSFSFDSFSPLPYYDKLFKNYNDKELLNNCITVLTLCLRFIDGIFIISIGNLDSFIDFYHKFNNNHSPSHCHCNTLATASFPYSNISSVTYKCDKWKTKGQHIYRLFRSLYIQQITHSAPLRNKDFYISELLT